MAPEARVRNEDTKIALPHHSSEEGWTTTTSLSSPTVRKQLTAIGSSTSPRKEAVANCVTFSINNCFWDGDYVFPLSVRWAMMNIHRFDDVGA